MQCCGLLQQHQLHIDKCFWTTCGNHEVWASMCPMSRLSPLANWTVDEVRQGQNPGRSMHYAFVRQEVVAEVPTP